MSLRNFAATCTRFQATLRWLSLCVTLVACVVALPTAGAQGLLPTNNSETANKTAATQPDPYGRDTPRSLATGLLAAFASGDYERAAQYLESPNGQKPASSVAAGKPTAPDTRIALAKQLQKKLDTSGSLRPISTLSNDASGNSDDGLPIDSERIGELNSASGESPLIAKRISPENATPYWVISAESLAAVSAATPELTKSALTDRLPEALGGARLGGVPLEDWLIVAVRAALSLLVAWTAFALVLRLLRALIKEPEKSQGYQFAEAAFPPLTLYVAVIAVSLLTQKLQVAIVAREVIARYATIIGWIAFVWFLWRLIDTVSDLWAARMARSDRRRAMSALVFARRSAKTVLVAIALVAVLDTLGINVTTGIAALGLGGLALALGAQKTVENLVGSVTVIADQPVRVGDFCKVGNVLGTVEDIGMRSTQIRTNERTVVTIPNGNFSSQQIENYSRRDRFLFNPVIGLTYDTTAAAMRSTLEAIRSLLDRDDNVIEGARVRFINFNASSLDVEIFAYIRTFDYATSLAMREELLLKIMETVAAEGASIAFPTRTLVIKSS